MCLNPRIIKNKRRDYYRALHVSELAVPCGCCEECVRQRRQDYSTRAIFESKRFENGTAIMVLLTYNDAHVPHMRYDGLEQMCFNHAHIKTLNDFLRCVYGSTLKKPRFSYLIGAEYGVDEAKTLRPHYHCLFWLDSTINPHDFMSTIRRVWCGELRDVISGKNTAHWTFGNLGLVLPFEDDREHPYIVESPQHAALYCAKYAVKQIGFFNKPCYNAIKRDYTDYNKRVPLKYKHCFPKVWTSRGFGMGIITDKNTDFAKGVSLDPFSLVEISIPRACLDKAKYVRVFRGRVRPNFDDCGNVILKKDGSISTHRLYERELKFEFVSFCHRQLDKCIDKLSTRFAAYTSPLMAKMCAVYHYVYNRLPLQGAMTFIREQISNAYAYGDLLTNHDLYHQVYDLTKLMRCDRSITKFIVNVHFDRYDCWGKLPLCNTNGIETFDMLFADVKKIHDRYYQVIDSDNHEKQQRLEDKYKKTNMLKSMLNPRHDIC